MPGSSAVKLSSFSRPGIASTFRFRFGTQKEWTTSALLSVIVTGSPTGTWTAFGLAVLSVIALVLLFGAADRLFVQSGLPYESQLWVFRGLLLVAPVATFLLTRRICRELRAGELRPARGETGAPSTRRPGELGPTEDG